MTACWRRIGTAAALTALVTAAPLAAAPDPTMDELRNATYSGLEGIAGPVTLSDGQWEGEPFVAGGESRPTVTFVEGFALRGDLDGDGARETAVLLAQGSGGTGEFMHLAVVARGEDGLKNVATALLGDRVEVREARLEDGRVLLEVLRPGPGDAECCPGELAVMGFTLEVDRLQPFDTGLAPTRLSLDALSGTDWVLESWAWNEPAPDEPEVTLRYEDGRFAGRSGCNQYSASARDGGDLPGDIEVGPGMGTRMACPEAQMAVERRFLAQLERVSRMGFTAGRLVLSYEMPGRLPRVMVFARR